VSAPSVTATREGIVPMKKSLICIPVSWRLPRTCLEFNLIVFVMSKFKVPRMIATFIAAYLVVGLSPQRDVF
jgi:hypothetical protein